MTTHLHKKDIWKMAALMLGESELKENSKIYRLMEAFYDTVRDDELRAWPYMRALMITNGACGDVWIT